MTAGRLVFFPIDSSALLDQMVFVMFAAIVLSEKPIRMLFAFWKYWWRHFIRSLMYLSTVIHFHVWSCDRDSKPRLCLLSSALYSYYVYDVFQRIRLR